MAGRPQSTDSGPVRESGRITSLGPDTRGRGAWHSADERCSLQVRRRALFQPERGRHGDMARLDCGHLGRGVRRPEIHGVFSLLFGAGMILFIDRASLKGRRAVVLNLWRNALLLLIGVFHFLLWDGDVLMAYAISSVFLIALRKLPSRALISVGAIVFMLSIACALIAQYMADTTSASLSGLWTAGEVSEQEAIGPTVLLGYFLRALGLITRRRRSVSDRLYEWRAAREDISTDCNGRACRRPPARRRRRHHHRS